MTTWEHNHNLASIKTAHFESVSPPSAPNSGCGGGGGAMGKSDFTRCTWRQQEREREREIERKRAREREKEGEREREICSSALFRFLDPRSASCAVSSERESEGERERGGERERKRKEYGFIWRSSRFGAALAERLEQEVWGSHDQLPRYRAACRSATGTPGHINGWDAARVSGCFEF